MSLLLTTPAPSRKLLNRVWEQTLWVPHAGQERIMFDRTRNQVVSFGRRAGKSQTGGNKLVPEYFRAHLEADDLKARGLRREYWIVGPTYSDSEKEFRVVWNALDGLGVPLDHPGSYNNPESGQMRISALGEKFIIHAKSAQYPQTLVGEGLSGVVFSEAAKLKPSVWIKYIRPTLADFGGWTYFGSTPEGRNWFYDLWEQGQDPSRTDWMSWRAPAWINPYVYPVGVDERLLDSAKRARRDGLMGSGWIVLSSLGMIDSCRRHQSGSTLRSGRSSWTNRRRCSTRRSRRSSTSSPDASSRTSTKSFTSLT
jgi:hypothetical protein